MSVKIKINQESPAEEKRVPQTKVKLNLRKTLGGDYIVHDHYDINIVIKPDEGRIVTFGKTDTVDIDTVYDAQNRLFDFLMKKGVIDHDSIQGGNIFGSMEAKLQDSDEVSTIQVAIYSISRFIEEERPYYMFRKSWEEDSLERYTNPSPEDSTELGEIPQANRKGSIDQWNTHAGRNARVYEGKERKLKETVGIPKIKAPGVSTRPETKGNYAKTKRQRDIYKKQTAASPEDKLGRTGEFSSKADKFVVTGGEETTKYHEAIHALFNDVKNNYGDGAYEFTARILARQIGVDLIKEIGSYLGASSKYSYLRGYSSVWDSPRGLEESIATTYSILSSKRMRKSVFGGRRHERDIINRLKAGWKRALKSAKEIDKDTLEIANKIIENLPNDARKKQDFIEKVYKNTDNKKTRDVIRKIAKSFKHLSAWMLDDIE